MFTSITFLHIIIFLIPLSCWRFWQITHVAFWCEKNILFSQFLSGMDWLHDNSAFVEISIPSLISCHSKTIWLTKYSWRGHKHFPVSCLHHFIHYNSITLGLSISCFVFVPVRFCARKKKFWR
jgi:hypothetical protein